MAVAGCMDADWADELAAAFSAKAALANDVTGPARGQVPAGQICIERDDSFD
ncbi:hypothetical protein [Streptomyces sp. NPDC052015]|uniref:hypothetical protein n=1 Tax=Streptomyces sp. NPDC052015 TaxID=3154755 RepID=UPI003436EE88